MKIDPKIVRRALPAVLLLAATASVPAQTAPASGSASTSQQETIELSPFVVRDDQDTGYIAQNTLAGSRLNTSLKDTAASLTVLTAEFLRDIAANSLEEAMDWTTNGSVERQESISFASGTTDDNSTFYNFPQFLIRGQAATTTVNYFRWRLPVDSYNMERVEEARGPNSILFGIGSAGGIVNVSTKRALFGRNIRHASLQAGSHDSYRGTIDLNQTLGKKLAVRFNGVWSNAHGYRHHTGSEERHGHVSVNYRLFEKTRIRAEYATGVVDQVIAFNDPVSDQFSNWTTRGARMLTEPIPAAENAAYGVSRLNATVQVYYFDNNNTVMNMANSYRTGGTDNFAAYYDPSLGDFSISTGGPGAVRRADYDTASIFLEQQIGRNTFVELAFNRQDNYSNTLQPLGNSKRLAADPNVLLPDGQPNPFAGRYFFDGESATWETGRKMENLRGSISNELDFGKWGNYRLAGMVEFEKRRNPENAKIEVWEGAPFHADPENALNFVRRRGYVTPGDWASFHRSTPKSTGLIRGLTDPITGRTLNSTMVPRFQAGTRDVVEDQETQLVAAQARFLKDRLVLGAGYRWDTLDAKDYTSQRNPQTRFWETDYSQPLQASSYEGRTKTFGVVGHVTRNISVFYNKSNNFGLPGSALILPDSKRPPNPVSEGEDIGLSFDLFGGKVFARANYYKIDLKNGSNFNYGGTLTNPSSISRIILDALVAQGHLTPEQSNTRRTNSTGSTFNRLVEGYEFSLTANPTRNWRLKADFSITEGSVSNIAPEVKAWVAENIPYFQGFDQNIVTGQQSLTIREVLEDFMEYHTIQLEGEGILLPNNRKYKAKLFTAYNFSEGALRGLSLGGGYTWQDKMPIGLLPGRQFRWGNEVWNTNLMLGYSFRNIAKLPWIKNLHLQLNVFNVTDDDEPTITRYASNDPSNPGYNILRRIRPKDPRTWRLTVDFDF